MQNFHLFSEFWYEYTKKLFLVLFWMFPNFARFVSIYGLNFENFLHLCVYILISIFVGWVCIFGIWIELVIGLNRENDVKKNKLVL